MPQVIEAAVGPEGFAQVTGTDQQAAACQARGVDASAVRYFSPAAAKVAAKAISLALGQRWINYVNWQSVLYNHPPEVDMEGLMGRMGLPMSSFSERIQEDPLR